MPPAGTLPSLCPLEVSDVNRQEMLTRLADQEHDLLVVGGGITGAGIAREASLRGLRVALVEAADFAYGTSSRSTKLIHGGLRYLKSFELRLVRESVIERQRLLVMAPNLAKVTPFLFPVYRGDPDGLLKLHAGLTLYDLFAGKSNPIAHRMVGPGEVLSFEPGLRSAGLLGGAVYGDSRTDDARLTLEVIQSAVTHGAVVANYVQVDGFLRGPGGRVAGVRAVDRLTGDRFEARAGSVLTAAGPWADAVRRLDDPAAPPLLRLTKGVHLTLPRARLPIERAVVIRGREGRMMFAIPSDDCTYVGTTDTDYDGDPSQVRVNSEDVEYVLEAVGRAFPDAGIGDGDIISAWAGLRPLLRPAKLRDPSATSRDYKLFFSPSGLVTVAGGKLTGFRAMGSHIVDRLYAATRGSSHLAKSTAPLPGAASPGLSTEDVTALAARTGAPRLYVARLADHYGGAIRGVVAQLPEAAAERPREDPSKASDPVLTWARARVRHAVKGEMAVRLEDVIWRRTEIMLFTADNGRGYLGPLAEEMATLLGWSAARQGAEIEQCRQRIDDMFVWRKEAGKWGQ